MILAVHGALYCLDKFNRIMLFYVCYECSVVYIKITRNEM